MQAEDNPYFLKETTGEHVFWADVVADRILERDPEEPIVIKGGISPSGVPHLGNMNEIMRGYFVAGCLRERGHEVRQIFTTDDRDPLRKLPRKLADLDGNIVDLGDVNAGALGRNLGKPYTDIPDPFGCCDSYGDHFSQLIEASADRLGVDVEMVSNTELYESGELEDVTAYLLENRESAREVLAEYQEKVDETYIPFRPICGECGNVTETDAITDIDLENRSVAYECQDLEAGDNVISGCGYEGEASFRDGKLPWRFEWPAQWQVLGVDYEPFGKDHAEGSWPSGVDVARNVLDNRPPVPMAYEWFTLEGEAFSSSAGHVVLVHDVLRLVEPAVVRFFFSKDPKKARDFSIERIDQLVDEFDRYEAAYFGEIDAGEALQTKADRIYPFLVDDLREERIRIPYTFAAVLGMTDDPALREEIARREGHITDDDPDWAIEAALDRVELAREWARRTDNEFNYALKRQKMPEHDFDAETEAALAELADFIESEQPDGDDLQGMIYETAKRRDIPLGEFFGAGYRLFFDEDQGPKLGQFLANLDEEFVVGRLRQEE